MSKPQILAIAAVIAALALPAGEAGAHRVFTYTDASGNQRPGAYWFGPYPTEYDDVRWAFAANFPGGQYRQAVVRGAQAWNGLNRRLQFQHDPNSVSVERTFEGTAHNCSKEQPPLERYGRPLAMVFWENLDGKALGQAGSCQKRDPNTGSYHMFTFRMVFDSGRSDWYRQPSGSVPPSKVDLQETAAHEFGHASGFWAHFNKLDHFPPPCDLTDKNRATMCAGGYRGQSRRRTISQHDRHTFEGAYG